MRSGARLKRARSRPLAPGLLLRADGGLVSRPRRPGGVRVADEAPEVAELARQVRERNREWDGKEAAAVPSAAVEGYIAQHQLDKKCAWKLRSLAPELQELVMQKDVSAAQNVTAVVTRLIQQAQSAYEVEALKRVVAKEAKWNAAAAAPPAGGDADADGVPLPSARDRLDPAAPRFIEFVLPFW